MKQQVKQFELFQPHPTMDGTNYLGFVLATHYYTDACGETIFMKNNKVICIMKNVEVNS